MKAVHVGCSGWNYAAWRELFYPKGLPTNRWLEHYAQHFGTVEVNSTFYRLPKRDAVARWVNQVPDDFVFTIKASRYLTHIKRLTFMDEGTARFYERIEPLVESGKLGPVLWQLPPNMKRDDERLANALEALPPGRHCFEFREPSWFTDEVYALLREHEVALVIGDRPEVAKFQTHEMTAGWTFVRFHYGHRGRRGNYSVSELEEWKRRVEQWRREREVFLYFNNDWEGFAIQNALWMGKRFQAAPPDVRGGYRDSF
jgi:uncharacterized protein YecE (DUF72 family)